MYNMLNETTEERKYLSIYIKTLFGLNLRFIGWNIIKKILIKKRAGFKS